MSLSVFSCAKNTDSQNCPPIEVSVPQNEITGLESFLEDQGIEALWHEKGFYYTILKEGNGATPNACSDINIAYEGSLTNGFVFDANDGIDFPLTKLITGWRLGVPLLKEGGGNYFVLTSDLRIWLKCASQYSRKFYFDFSNRIT